MSKKTKKNDCDKFKHCKDKLKIFDDINFDSHEDASNYCEEDLDSWEKEEKDEKDKITDASGEFINTILPICCNLLAVGSTGCAGIRPCDAMRLFPSGEVAKMPIPFIKPFNMKYISDSKSEGIQLQPGRYSVYFEINPISINGASPPNVSISLNSKPYTTFIASNPPIISSFILDVVKKDTLFSVVIDRPVVLRPLPNTLNISPKGENDVVVHVKLYTIPGP